MNKSKQISLGAMVTIFSIIILYMTAVLPTAKIFLVSLSSFLIAILIIEIGKPTAIMSFMSTSILGFIVIPNKLLIVPYVVFLGYYGVLKSYIESLNNIVFEWIIKLIVFNIALYVNYILFTNVFAKDLVLPFSIWIIILGLQFLFVIYDYVFSMFISYYNNNLRKYVK